MKNKYWLFLAVAVWFLVGLSLGLLAELDIVYSYNDDYLIEFMLCGEALGIVEGVMDEEYLSVDEMFDLCNDIINVEKIRFNPPYVCTECETV